MKDYDCVWLSVVNMHQRRKRKRMTQQKSDGPQVKKKIEKEVGLFKHVKNHHTFKVMGLGRQSESHKKQKLELETQKEVQNTPLEENANVIVLKTENQILSQCLENRRGNPKPQLESTAYSMGTNSEHVNDSSSVEDIGVHYREEMLSVNENINRVPSKEMLVGSSIDESIASTSTTGAGKLDILGKVENESLSKQKIIKGSKERDSLQFGIIGADYEERSVFTAQKRSKSLPVIGIEILKTPKFCVKRFDDKDLTCSFDAKPSSETTIPCNLEEIQMDDCENASEENIVSHKDISGVLDNTFDDEMCLPSVDNARNKLGKTGRSNCKKDLEEMVVEDNKEIYCKEHLRSILQAAGVLGEGNCLVALHLLPVSNELVFAALNCGLFSHDHVYFWICKIFKKGRKSNCTKISQTQYGWFEELHEYISSSDSKARWKNILQNTLYSPPKCGELCLLFNLSDFLKDDIIHFYTYVQGKKDPSFSYSFGSSGKPAEVGDPSVVGKDATAVKTVQASQGIGGSYASKSDLQKMYKGESGKQGPECFDTRKETKIAKCKAASGDHQYHAIIEELRGAIKNVRLLTSSGKVSTARYEDKKKRELSEGGEKYLDEKKKCSDGERRGKCVQYFDSVLHNLYLLMTDNRSSVKNIQEVLKEFYWNLRQVESTLHCQRKEIERMQAKTKAAEVKNQQLVKSNEELRKELEKSKFEVKTKYIHNQQLKKLIKEANDKVSAKDLTVRQMESKKMLMKTKLKKLEEHVNVLRAECKSKELQCKEMKIKNDEAIGKAEQAKNREAELLALINHQTLLLDQSENAEKLKDSLMRQMCLELKAMQAKVQALTSDNMNYEGKIKDLESLLEQNKSSEANLVDKLREKESMIPQLDKANEILRSQVNSLKENGGDLFSQKERLSTRLKELEERLVCCCSIMSENEKTINRLKDAVMESQNETKRKEQDIVILNEKILSLESDIKDKNRVIEQIQQETSYFTDALKDQYERLKELNGQQHCMALQTTALSCIGSECGGDQMGNEYASLRKESYINDCLSELVLLLKNRKDELRELTNSLRELEIKFRKNLEFPCAVEDPLNIGTLVEDVTMLIFTSLETSEKISTFLDHGKALQTKMNTDSGEPTVNIKCCIQKQELKMTQHMTSSEESRSLRVYVKSSLKYDMTSIKKKEVEHYDMQVQDTQEPKHQLKCLVQGQSLDFVSRTKNKEVTSETVEASKELFSRRVKKGNDFEKSNSHTESLSKDASLERKDRTAFTKNWSHKDGKSRDFSSIEGKNDNVSSMTKLDKFSGERVSVSKKLCSEKIKPFTIDRKGKESKMRKGASSLDFDSLSDIPQVEMSCIRGRLSDTSLKKLHAEKRKQATVEGKCASKHLVSIGNQSGMKQVQLSEHQRIPSIPDFDARYSSPSLELKKCSHVKMSRDSATADSDGKSLCDSHQKIISFNPATKVQVAGVCKLHSQGNENTVPKRLFEIANYSGVLQPCGIDRHLSVDLCAATDSSPSKQTKQEKPAEHQECLKNSDRSFDLDSVIMDSVCKSNRVERPSSSFYITGNENRHSTDTSSPVMGDQDSEQDSESEKIRRDIMQSCGNVLKYLQREMDKASEDSKKSMTDCNTREEQATDVCPVKSSLYEPIYSENDESSESAFRNFDEHSVLPDTGMKCQSFESTGTLCLLPQLSQLGDAREKDTTVDSRGKHYKVQPVTWGKELVNLHVNENVEEPLSEKCKSSNLKSSNYKRTAVKEGEEDQSYGVSEGNMERGSSGVGIKLKLEEKYGTKSNEIKTGEQRDRKKISTGGRADKKGSQKQNFEGDRSGGILGNSEAVKDECVENHPNKEPGRDREHLNSREKRKMVFQWLKDQTLEIGLRIPVDSGKKRKMILDQEKKHGMLERKGSKHNLPEDTPSQADGRASKRKKFAAIEKWLKSHPGCRGGETDLKGENQGVKLHKGKVSKKSESVERDIVGEGTSSIKITDEGRSNGNEKEEIDNESGVVRRTVTSVFPARCGSVCKSTISEAISLKRSSVLKERNIKRDIILARMWQKIVSLEKHHENVDEHLNMLEKDNDNLVILLQEKNAALNKAVEEKKNIESTLKGKENALELCYSNALKRKAFINKLEKDKLNLFGEKKNLEKELKKCANEIMAMQETIDDINKCLSQKMEIIDHQGRYIGELLREKVEAENALKAVRENSEKVLGKEIKLISERLCEKESFIGKLLIEKAKVEELLEARTRDAGEKEKCLNNVVKEKLLLKRTLKVSMALYNEQKAVIAERESYILELQRQKIKYEALSRILAEQLHGKECTTTVNVDQKEMLLKPLKQSSDHDFSAAESLQIYSCSTVVKSSENEIKDNKCTTFQEDHIEVLSKKTDQDILIEDAYPSVDSLPLPMASDITSKIQDEFYKTETNMHMDIIFDKENALVILMEERKMANVLKEEHWALKKTITQIRSKIRAIKIEFNLHYEDGNKEWNIERKMTVEDEGRDLHPYPAPGNETDQLPQISKQNETGDPDMGTLVREIDMEIDSFVVVKAQNIRLENRLQTIIKENGDLGVTIDLLVSGKTELEKTVNKLSAEKEDLSKTLKKKEDELCKERECHSITLKVLDEERKKLEHLVEKNQGLVDEADKQQKVIDGYIAELKECKIEIGEKESMSVDLQKKIECIKDLKSQIKSLKKELEKSNKETFEIGRVIDSLLREQDNLKEKLKVADMQVKTEIDEHCNTKYKFANESEKLKESIEERQHLAQALLTKEQLLSELTENWHTEKNKLLQKVSDQESLNLKLLKDKEQWQIKLKLREKKYHLLLREKSNVFRSEVSILSEQFSSFKEFNSWLMDQYNYLAESRFRLRNALNLQVSKNLLSIPTSEEIEEVQRISSALQQKEGEVDALKVLLWNEEAKTERLVETLQEEQLKTDGAVKNLQEYQSRIEAAEENAREAWNSKEAVLAELEEEQMKNKSTVMVLSEKAMKIEYAEKLLQNQQAKIEAYEKHLQEGQIRATMSYREMQEEQRKSEALRIALQQEQLRMESVSYALLGEKAQGHDVTIKFNNSNMNMDTEAEVGPLMQKQDRSCQTEENGEDYASYQAQIARLQYDWNLEKMASRYFCEKLIEEYIDAKEHLEFELDLMKCVIDRQLKTKARLRELLAYNADDVNV